jgi:hypothetical protein
MKNLQFTERNMHVVGIDVVMLQVLKTQGPREA